jgi:hypothetical protein
LLADASFGSNELIPGAQKLGFEVLMSICCDRCLENGQSVQEVPRWGQSVKLKDLDIPLTLSWFWRKHEDTGERNQHFVVATEALSGAYIVRLGKRRWAIEACFKTLKHQFGWDCFGQGTLLGMYRWWILSCIIYLLAHWQFLSSGQTTLDGQQAAHQARQQLFPQEVLSCFLHDLNQVQPILAQLGVVITVSRVPVAA